MIRDVLVGKIQRAQGRTSRVDGAGTCEKGIRHKAENTNSYQWVEANKTNKLSKANEKRVWDFRRAKEHGVSCENDPF